MRSNEMKSKITPESMTIEKIKPNSPFLIRHLYLLPAVILIGVMFFFSYQLFVFKIWNQPFWAVSDDIYISACFARTLAQGHGLLWYPGAPPVEGISNPLWTGILALIHVLPWYEENMLGLYLFGINAVLLAGIAYMFWSIVRVSFGLYFPEKTFSPGRAILPVLLLSLCFSLSYWLAEGFEVGLVLLFALTAFRITLLPSESLRSAVAAGVLAGLAFWTRMDAVLYCAPAFLLLMQGNQRWRRIAAAAAAFFIMALALFLVRHAYYDKWLPNTYYLKLYGWPLGQRLAKGLQLNWPLLPSLLLVTGMLSLPPAWRFFGKPRLPVAACALAVFLGVAYSIQNGGDSWGLKAGFDRFTVPGAVFLSLALSLVWICLPLTFWRVRVFAIGSILLMCLSIIPHFGQFRDDAVFPKQPRLEQSWIRSGKSFERVTLPGARIALNPAGAIIYFSHRGGVDLLGKCEPLVAKSPVVNPAAMSGHNKRDDVRVFKARKPDVTRNTPPRRVLSEYMHVVGNGREF